MSHDPAAEDLADEITRRLAERKAATTARRQTRRALRVELAARRTFGLAARHASKLAKADEGQDRMKPEQIEARDYTYCTAMYIDPSKPGGSGLHWENFLVGTPSRIEARERAMAYARTRWGEPDDLSIYPRNYVREARGLYRAGRHD